MGKLRAALRDTFLWTFGRGTWQYDLMCALILAFIFLTPAALFRENRSYHPRNRPAETATVPAPTPQNVPQQESEAGRQP